MQTITEADGNSEHQTKRIRSWREPLRDVCDNIAVTPRHDPIRSDPTPEASTSSSDSVNALIQLMERAVSLLHTTVTPAIESNSCCDVSVVASARAEMSSRIGDDRYDDEYSGPCGGPTSLNYDPDESPLTLAVNKSLDMSKSLTEHCTRMGDLTTSSEEEGEGEGKEKMEDGEGVEKMGERTGEERMGKGLEKKGEGKEKMGEREGARSSSVSNVGVKSTISFQVPTEPLQELTSNEVLRRRIVQEILDTERKYCACLSTVLDHFRKSVHLSAIITDNDVNTMFPPCLEIIRSHHRRFLQKLGDRLNCSEWQCILGDVFASFILSPEGDLFAQYQLYVGGFSETVLFIRKTSRRNSTFKKLISKLEADSCCEGLGIDAFLHAPVQRMPRYILLLKQLLRNTSTNHPDHYNITICLDKLSDFLDRLNETIEQSLSLVLCESSLSNPRKPKRARFSFTSRASVPNARHAVVPPVSEQRKGSTKHDDATVGRNDLEQGNCTGKENAFCAQINSALSLDKTVRKDSIDDDNDSFFSSSYDNLRSTLKSKIIKQQIGVPESHSTPFRTNLVLRQGKMMWNGRDTAVADGNNPRKRKYPSSKANAASTAFPPESRLTVNSPTRDNRVFDDFKCPIDPIKNASSTKRVNSFNASDVSFTKLQSKNKYKSFKRALGLGGNGRDNPSFAFESSDTLKVASDQRSYSLDFSEDCNRDVPYALSEIDVGNQSAGSFVDRTADEKTTNQSARRASTMEAANMDRSFFAPQNHRRTASEVARENAAVEEYYSCGKNIRKSSRVPEMKLRSNNKKSFFEAENRKILETFEENAIEECKATATGENADSSNKIVNVNGVDCISIERTSDNSTDDSKFAVTASSIDQKGCNLDSTITDSPSALSEIDAAASQDVFAKPFPGTESKEKTAQLQRLNVSFLNSSVIKSAFTSTESIVPKRGLFRRHSSKKESGDVSIANVSVVHDMSFGDTSTSVKRKPSFTDTIRKFFVKKRPEKVHEEDSIIEDPSVQRST